MKKILFAFLGFIFITLSVMGLTDIPVEKIYLFTQDNVSETIQEFISDENLQIEAAKKYASLVDSDGKISAVDFVDVCIAGGIKAKKSEGYEQCLDFFHALLDNSEIEMSDGGFNMNCPASGNGLKSITDETLVGDVCESTNISFGEVILKKKDKKYICTCQSYACNPGYKLDGGQCKEDVKDEEGNCYRNETEFTFDNKSVGVVKAGGELAMAAHSACQSYADKKNCKLKRILPPVAVNDTKDNTKYKVTCNPTQEEVDQIKADREAHRNAVLDKKLANGYKRACGADAGKKGLKTVCINFFKDTQVQVSQGIVLAKEYAAKKYGAEGLRCNNERRPADNTDDLTYTNQDFLQCYYPAKDIWAEFEFDDLKETRTLVANGDFITGICNISGKWNDDKHFCEMKQSDCIALRKKQNEYGLISKTIDEYRNELKQKYESRKNKGYKKPYMYEDITEKNICIFDSTASGFSSRKDLKTAYGIDNFTFCKGGNLQFQNTGGLTDALKSYVVKAAKVSSSSVTCSAITYPYYGGGCNPNKIGFQDDVISCYVGQNRIDFVFDDVNELNYSYAHGAQQGMDCLINGGTYDGKRCLGLGEEQCETLRQANLKNCPECKSVRWDDKTQSCTLPSSETATNIKKGVDIAMIVAGAVVGVVVTIATAGESGTPVVAWVLTTVETVGAGIELTAQLKIDGIADEFLVKSNRCQNASCAEKLISENLQRLANVQNDMDELAIDAIDKEIARLAKLIPDDSEFFTRIANSDDLSLGNVADNTKFVDSWEPEQIWRAVGIGLQFVSLITAIGKFVIGKSPRLQRATAVFKNKIKNNKIVSKVFSKNAAGAVDDAVDTAKVAGKTDNVADAAKTTDKVEDATTVVAKTDDAKFTSKTEIFGNTADQTVDMEKIKKYREEGFDDKLKMFKKNNSRTISIQKGKLTDAEWNELNKSLASENVQLVDNGDGYMRFVSTGNTDDAVSVSKAVDNTKSASNSELAKKFNMGTSQNADDAASVSKAVDNTNTKSLSEIEYAYEEKLHNDVLTLQQEAGMKEKVEKYNEMLERAKKELSPEDYKAFEEMKNAEIGTMVENPGQKAFYWEGEYRMKKDLNLMEENLKKNPETRGSVDAYTANKRDDIATREEYLKYFRQKNPKAAKFFDDNIETMHDAEDVIISSDKKLLAKKANMNKEMAKIVDNETLAKPVKEFKQNIIANFPESMYKKAKNWSNMTIDQRKSFISNEIQPYLQRMQGCDGVKCEVQFKSISEIGGNASYSPGKLSVSDDFALHLDFDNVFAEIVHENVHLGQVEFKNMSEELVSLSNKNALDLTIDFQSYRLNPTERQAYVVNNRKGVDKGIFLNFLHDVAEYHGWK